MATEPDEEATMPREADKENNRIHRPEQRKGAGWGRLRGNGCLDASLGARNSSVIAHG